MPTNGETEQDKTGIPILDNPQLYDLVVRRISDEVVGRLLSRAVITLSVVGVLLGILSVVYHNAVVEEATDTAVNNSIGEIRKQVEVASLSFELTVLVNSIHEGEGFSSQEKDAAMNLLERAANLDELIESDTFLLQLERLIDALAMGDVGLDINRLEEMYRPQISKSGGIVSTLIQHYGRLILETPGVPDDWNSGINLDNFERYERYIGLAEPHAYPELYIFFQMLVEYLRSDDSNVREIIAEINDLNENDLQLFKNIVEQYAMNKLSSEPSIKGTRASKRVISFLETYQDTREEFRLILNQVKAYERR